MSHGTHPRNHARWLWLRAESFIHVGSGQGGDFIDLPFVREGGSGYPYIPGSGMKGALRDTARLVKGFNSQNRVDVPCVQSWFGKADDAGQFLVSDARLVFLPVRSLATSYQYLTSIGLLRRLARDLDFAGWPPAEAGAAWGALTSCLKAKDTAFTLEHDCDVWLEEYRFKSAEPEDQETRTIIENLISDLLKGLSESPEKVSDLRLTQQDIKERLVIVSDQAFDYFARQGLHVRMRNALDPSTKTVGNGLWSEESLPPDTILYLLMVPRTLDKSHKKALDDFLSDVLLNTECGGAGGYLQVGGNETVGEGWLAAFRDNRAGSDAQASSGPADNAAKGA